MPPDQRKHTEKTLYRLGGLEFPLHIHQEHRNSVRVSIGKHAVHFRIPWGLSQKDRLEYAKWLEDWLNDHKGSLSRRFAPRHYTHGQTILVGDRSYTLSMAETDNKSHSAHLLGGVIHVGLSRQSHSGGKAVKTLLSRVIGKDYLPEITRRVMELNRLHFRVPISGVKLRYTSSRWGSCSSNGNLNFSTRLLFAPGWVVDYVIIHELAHRIEMNHSARFWKLVGDAMPEYKAAETWLKTEGKDCDF